MAEDQLRAAMLERARREKARRQQAAPERTLGQTIYENVVGSGEIDTPGERIGAGVQDVLRSLGAGVSRGVTGLLDAPGAAFEAMGSGVTSGLEAGAEAVGIEAPELFEATRQTFRQLPLRGGVATEAASQATGGATEFRGETLPGQFAGTVGEFLPGSLIGPGGAASNAVRFGLIPGVASEAAGQVTEGTALEGPARAAAAIAAPVLASRVQNVSRPLLSADDEAIRQAQTLRQAGVRPTAGQITGSDTLRRMEGVIEPTARQLSDFTEATMRSIGSTAKKATPEALAKAEQAIVQTMDDALSGVTVVPTQSAAQSAAAIADDYVRNAPAATIVPRVRQVVRQIGEAAKSGDPIELSTMRKWRTALGRMTSSPDEATREAAAGIRRVIDNMTDSALVQSGRNDALSALRSARERYRNFLAVSDASTRAGAETGMLSPTQLNQSIIRTQGRRRFATGSGTTDLADLSRAGASQLRPLPTVGAGGIRDILTGPALGLGAGGAGLAAGISPAGAAAAALGATVLPKVAQSAMRSGPVQSLLLDPQTVLQNISRSSSGLLAQ